MSWRKVMRFDDEADVDFVSVHDRYREMLLTTSDLDADRLRLLAKALNDAREELGTQRPRR